ncbi:MAG: glycosyltransferase family 2 protein [Saprospiraceae bacterium]
MTDQTVANTPSTALVILNYNGRQYLEKFLPSVIKYSSRDTLMVVGDNNSTDESVIFLQTHYPTVRIISLDKNYGFAEGYNQVLKQIKTEYYFLLNNDVELRSTWTSLIKTLHLNPKLAAAQPKILSYAQPTQFEHAGAAGGWLDTLGYPFCQGRIFDFIEKDMNQYDQQNGIFWASGAAMMVRASVYHEIGGFDKDYFAHMEEIDWCWRAKRCGWNIMSVPDVSVFHVGGGTLPYQSGQKIFLNFRNNLATLFKNDSILNLIYKLPIRFILDAATALSFLIKKNPKGSMAVARAYINFIQWIPALISKRKVINQLSNGTTFIPEGLFKGSILIEYFIKGHKTFQSIISYHE